MISNQIDQSIQFHKVFTSPAISSSVVNGMMFYNNVMA